MKYIAPVADPHPSDRETRAAASAAAGIIRRQALADRDALPDHPEGRAAADALAAALGRLSETLKHPPDPAEPTE